MTKSNIFLRMPFAAALVIGLFTALGPGTATSASAQTIKAVVDNIVITSHELKERRALINLIQRTNPPEREVLDQLIEELLIRIDAQRRRITASDAQVDARYRQVAGDVKLSIAQLGQVLAQRGTSEKAFKQLIRAQLLYGQLLRARFDLSRAVSENDISSQLSQRRDSASKSYRYTLRQIIFTLPKNASNATVQQRRQEANSLRTRIRSCDEAVQLGRGLRNVYVRDPSIRAGSQLPDEMNETLSKMSIGTATSPSQGEQGVEIFALCDRQEINDDSALRQQIQFELADERFKVEGRKLVNELRQRAIIQYR